MAKRSGKGGGWKNSPIVAVILIVGILICWIAMFFGGGKDNEISDLMAQQERVYITAGKKGRKIKKVGGAWESKVPFKEGGKTYWKAYECTNKECPGLKGEKRYVFAFVKKKLTKEQAMEQGMLPPTMEGEPEQKGPFYDENQMAECPKCKKAEIEQAPDSIPEIYYSKQGRETQDKIMKIIKDKQEKGKKKKKKKKS